MNLSNNVALKIANAISTEKFTKSDFLYDGASSQAWKVESEQTKLIVRVMRPGVGRPTTYQSECEIFRQLKGLLVPVPDSVATYKDRKIDGVDYAWAVTKEIDGVAVGNKKLTRQVMKDLGEVLSKVHSLPISRFGRLTEQGGSLVGLQESPLEGILARYCFGQLWPFNKSQIGQNSGYSYFSALEGPILQCKERVNEIADDENVVLVHSDINGKHIFVKDDHLNGLIDFGAAFIGIPEWEFGRLGFEFGWDATREILKSYTIFSDRKLNYDTVYLTGLVFALYKIDRNVREGSPENKIAKSLTFLKQTLSLLDGQRGV